MKSWSESFNRRAERRKIVQRNQRMVESLIGEHAQGFVHLPPELLVLQPWQMRIIADLAERRRRRALSAAF